MTTHTVKVKRAQLKQWLEAFESDYTFEWPAMRRPEKNEKKRFEAITAIKEALANHREDNLAMVAHLERHKLQARGEHPAPCARHCEANAFQIVIKNLKDELKQALAQPAPKSEKTKIQKQCYIRFYEDFDVFCDNRYIHVALFDVDGVKQCCHLSGQDDWELSYTGSDAGDKFEELLTLEEVSWADFERMTFRQYG